MSRDGKGWNDPSSGDASSKVRELDRYRENYDAINWKKSFPVPVLADAGRLVPEEMALKSGEARESTTTHDRKRAAGLATDSRGGEIPFLENRDYDWIRWHRGCIMVDTSQEKIFKSLGGDARLLQSCFEDNGEMNGAVEDYKKEIAKRSASK
jgi:hypothetical protein